MVKDLPIESIYERFPGVVEFIRIYYSLIVSEAAIERLFSYYHRCQATFLRASLDIKTLEHLGRIYINCLLKEEA